jgi:hypothetical protein
MRSKHLLLAVILVLVGFAGGRAMPRPAAPPVATPVADAPELPVMPARADAVEHGLKNELASAKAQLAICLAFRRSPDPSTPAPSPEMDEETARLVRTHTTNTEWITVERADGAIRVYGPGAWPPPDGPPSGSRIVARKVDGGTALYVADGGVRVVADRPMLCPCPSDTLDAGPDLR